MKIRAIAIAGVALFLPLAAASCGGDDSTGDLSKDDISKQLKDAGLPAAQADCIADKVQSADLTKEELDDFNKSQDTSSKAGKALMDAVLGCTTAATGN